MRRSVLPFLLSLLLVHPYQPARAAEAAACYVAITGSDSGSGSEASPFRTIARAARTARPGVTIFVGPGNYEGGLRTMASGTAEARIRYVSTTPLGAVLTPPADSHSTYAWENRGSYVDIVGFEVDGSHPQGGDLWTHGIYCGGSYCLVSHNHVHHIGVEAPCTSAGGSGIGTDSYYHGEWSDVVGNVVHDIGPAGCRFFQGIYVSTSGSVRNNVVYRVAEGGIHLWHDANHVTICHNTVAACETGIIVGGADFYHTQGPDDDTTVYNNIVYDNARGIVEMGRTGEHNSYSHNLVSGNSITNWRLQHGLRPTDSIEARPNFVSYNRSGTPDFHLQFGSPGLSAGLAAAIPEPDILGHPRPRANPDLGAYQR